MRQLLLIVLTCLLAACATSAPAPEGNPATDANMATSCTVDADCAVKNVCRCCGYYPQCVNTAHQPNPVGVQAACAREGRSSTCGFAEIAGCRCVDSHCSASETGASPL